MAIAVRSRRTLKRSEWVGHYRIRTGDWRVLFRVVTPKLLVVRIKHRREVYDD
jgi:mRNA-degrading endonuclease RelE of RelBE toxin-antitoxin system